MKMEDPKPLDVEIKVQESTFVACKGTGTRHRSRPWPTSSANNTCRLVIPPESKDKKFVFFIGDSHLRAIVDGFAPIKEESLYFGFLAVPGGAALDLRTEILNAVIPRIPDLVCLLAPSNTLKRSTVVSEAGKQFKKLLTTVCILSPKVFVLDFPPRLNVDPQVQSLLRQEFHRVSVQLGVSYKSVAELFPMRKLHLWSRDGVHLSDDDGMKILNKAIYEQIHKPPTETEVMPTMSCSSPKFLEQVPKPTAEKVSKLVCAPEVPVVAPQNPFEWNIVGSHKKVNCWIFLPPLSFKSLLAAGFPAFICALSKPLPAVGFSVVSVPQVKPLLAAGFPAFSEFQQPCSQELSPVRQLLLSSTPQFQSSPASLVSSSTTHLSVNKLSVNSSVCVVSILGSSKKNHDTDILEKATFLPTEDSEK
uniref:Uncharacterized protein n=1 Tax=Fundulus heteroclitus TaxID=8078 RepID=A0A3Q2QWH2_FUNHE